MLNEPCVVVPYFGTKYRGLLDRWVEEYKASGARWPYILAIPEPIDLPYPAVVFDVTPYRPYMRQGMSFDLKGALVCAAALNLGEFLALDVDAFVRREFAMHCLAHGSAALAMPWDYGAYSHGRRSMLDYPYQRVPKRCAGVIWFGDVKARKDLVFEYRRAWTELKGLMPWTPPLPHLLEQYAWSVACERMNGAELPLQMNWSPDVFGPSKTACIYHYFGKRKFEMPA